MWLTIEHGTDRGRTIEVTGESFIIGRGDTCDLVLRDEKVSRQHAALKSAPHGGVMLSDLGSTNGTMVDGRRLEVPVFLHGGEELRVGDTVLSVAAAAPSRPAASPGATRRPGRSTLERLRLQRSLRRTTVLSTAAIVSVAATVVLFATGVLPPDQEEPPREPNVAEIVEAAAPSVVQVLTSGGDGAVSSGTGWVLDASEGLVVTNHHVVNGGTAFEIGVGRRPRPARLVAAAPCEDLALLRTRDRTGLKTMPLGSQAQLDLGETVVAVGFPASASSRDELTATTGVVSVARRSTDGEGEVPDFTNVVQTDAAINPGNSGGPLLSTDKVLIGVNTFGAATLQNVNYAIGVDRVKEVAGELRRGRSRAWTGLALGFPEDPSELTDLGLPPVPGLLALGALPGTPARSAGLGSGPVLVVAIDGRPVDAGLPSYCDVVGGHRRGDTAVFRVLRPGARGPVDVRVGFE